MADLSYLRVSERLIKSICKLTQMIYIMFLCQISP